MAKKKKNHSLNFIIICVNPCYISNIEKYIWRRDRKKMILLSVKKNQAELY